ncbi:MAG: acyltransferase [Tannerella sp.]|jgi:peptidoglycan/LPS O-acetylase OafA/YrhL|nr:acyltransferase [Tannerella sp.]
MTDENSDRLQSNTIDWLRFPLAIAVVFIHINPVVDMQGVDYFHFSGMDIYTVAGALISRVLTYVAVPCFFMFSGFLFFYKVRGWNRNIYRNKIKRRLKTLVLPFLLWNVIAVCVGAAIQLIKPEGDILGYIHELYDKGLWRIFWNCTEWGSTDTNIFGWANPFYGPYLLPLWFLRDLIIAVFLSPLVYYFVKYARMYGVVLLGILYYAQAGIAVAGYNINQLITALFFFSIGGYFGIYGKNMVISLRKGQLYWLLAAVVFLILSTFYDGSDMKKYFLPVYVISGVITTVNITSFLMERGKLKVYNTLSGASFFVYATHTILVLSVSRKLINFILPPDNMIILLIKFLVTPFLCAFLCVGIYLLMKRFVPKLLSVLTGNR